MNYANNTIKGRKEIAVYIATIINARAHLAEVKNYKEPAWRNYRIAVAREYEASSIYMLHMQHGITLPRYTEVLLSCAQDELSRTRAIYNESICK